MRSMHVAGIALACVSLCAVERVAAQSQPATIPTVVAQAMFLDFSSMIGKPRYFVDRTPPGWPSSLVPANARVVGGGDVGDSSMFHMQSAVFEFSARANPPELLRALIAKAGYEQPHMVPPKQGGFVGSGPPEPMAGFCKGASMVNFAPVDSVKSRRVVAVYMLDGQAALQNCGPRRESMMMMDPNHGLTIPSLSAPRGTVARPGGSSWGGSTGEIHSTLRTTLPADSILAHYTPQLVAAGWKVEGKAAANDVIAMQQFSFLDHDDAWKGALIVMSVGDRRDVVLRLAKVNSEY